MSRPGLVCLSFSTLLLAALAAPLAPASAQAPGPSPAQAPAPAPAQPPAQPAPNPDLTLTPPPVVDPKAVETRPVIPNPAPETFAGEEITLAPVPVLSKVAQTSWDEGIDTIAATVKALEAEANRLGLKRSGDVFVVYTNSDDLGFEFEAQLPFSGTTTQRPSGDMKLGGSHAGRVMRFTHKGSFADMDSTYEQIANYLDARNLEAEDLYIEQYRTDPATTPADALVIDILVPLR